MSSGIYVATAGAIAQSNALDITANNIANASVAGFKGDRVSFKEALTAARSPDVASVGVASARIDTQAGAMTQTENPLDIALEGDGYFAVQTPDGTRYTRAGNLRMNDDNKLVNGDGFIVRSAVGIPVDRAGRTLPKEAAQNAAALAIEIPPGTEVSIATDGTISAGANVLGKLELVRFQPNQIKREGATLYSATGVPQTTELPKVQAGMLEASNINVVRGVVDLVKVSRTYESLMRVIQGFHDVESRAARELGGPK